MTTCTSNDIVEAVDHIARFVAGMDLQEFLESELVRSGEPERPESAGSMAADRGLSQHSDPRVFRDRLE